MTAAPSFQPLEARFDAMTRARLPAVLRVEQSAYPHPWSEHNFLDSMLAGYQAQLLVAGSAESPELLGYFVAMKGVDEVHLLNITVAPASQHQGWGRVMLDALGVWSRGQGAQWLWLEVRVSNMRARAVYESHGFKHVGTRRHYYPASPGLPQGEDAIVMSRAL
ncbi:ribosomal-protein-alanine N-acetyltransferase [Polaromonas sp. CG_9.5]|uniref:ribosomal protein S18-alanine N-acetyltransferase n=1 Tax=Polaromonas sp. CG_9.5 TaxID=3071705 RepID=UPI002E0173E3|nr:ribosomal-protein-alanine N-acetyltransferase [Polaromonas sp. CG_9.5]